MNLKASSLKRVPYGGLMQKDLQKDFFKKVYTIELLPEIRTGVYPSPFLVTRKNESMFGLRLWQDTYQPVNYGLKRAVMMVHGKSSGKMIKLSIIMFMEKIIFLSIQSSGQPFYWPKDLCICQTILFPQNT